MTWTTGGVMSGYWSIGRVASEISPARVMTMEMTKANFGRSTKKWLSMR